LASLPVLTAFITLLLALKALKRFLALSLRKHTQQGSKPPSSDPSAVMTPEEAQSPAPEPYAEVWVDEFDPATDEWCGWLDLPEVIESCIPHLERCLQRDHTSHP
jgi:hypothetical protein